MKYHTGLLHNEATNRWHPISFREAPCPSEFGEAVVRHKSIGHHTEGFATEAEASAWIAAQPQLVPMGVAYSWKGDDMPAMVLHLPALSQEFTPATPMHCGG